MSRRGTRDGVCGSAFEILSKGTGGQLGGTCHWAVECKLGPRDRAAVRNNGYAHGPYQDNGLDMDQRGYPRIGCQCSRSRHDLWVGLSADPVCEGRSALLIFLISSFLVIFHIDMNKVCWQELKNTQRNSD